MPGPAFVALASAIDRRIPSDRAAQLLADYRAEVRAEYEQEQGAEPAQPSPAHSAVYLDQKDRLWSDYPTVPPGDEVLPMEWASVQAHSKADLAERGIELRVIGWCK